MISLKTALFVLYVVIAGVTGWWFYSTTFSAWLDRLHRTGQIRLEQLVVAAGQSA